MAHHFLKSKMCVYMWQVQLQIGKKNWLFNVNIWRSKREWIKSIRIIIIKILINVVIIIIIIVNSFGLLFFVSPFFFYFYFLFLKVFLYVCALLFHCKQLTIVMAITFYTQHFCLHSMNEWMNQVWVEKIDIKSTSVLH